jgi:hypothetical protein
MKKFLDTFAPPEGSTHVAVHQAENGKMGARMSGHDKAGNVFDLFELSGITREFIAGTWGPGTYRFAFYSVVGGKSKRLGPHGGAVEIGPVAPAKPAKAVVPAENMTGMQLFAFLTELQDRADARAEARASASIERDRQYQTALLTAVTTAGRAPVQAASAEDMKRLIADAVADAVAEGVEEGEQGTMVAQAGTKLMASISNAIDMAIAKKMGGVAE